MLCSRKDKRKQFEYMPCVCPRQCVAVCCCSALQCVAVRCSALQCVAVCCSALQCVAVRCSALQCVAVRCSVLQCVAVYVAVRRIHKSSECMCARHLLRSFNCSTTSSVQCVVVVCCCVVLLQCVPNPRTVERMPGTSVRRGTCR